MSFSNLFELNAERQLPVFSIYKSITYFWVKCLGNSRLLAIT